jgi:hypothetical protein
MACNWVIGSPFTSAYLRCARATALASPALGRFAAYVLTLAIFSTELYNRLLRPLTAVGQPQARPALRQTLTVIDHHVDDYIARARLKHEA